MASKNVGCKLNLVNVRELVDRKHQIFSFDGVDFTSATPTKCDHVEGGLANYKGLALTTGTGHYTACYVRSELYNFDTNQWTDAPNYPYTK